MDREGDYIKIEKYLITSDAFIDLGFSARCALIHFFERGNPTTRLVIFPYREAKSFGFTMTTFRKVILELQEHGFIEVVHRGLGGAGSIASSKYVLSDNWIVWEKGDENIGEVHKPEKQRERGKVNLSLRYKTMLRDNFHCQLCGMTGRDSQLVVDHIYPWDKGGKTELNNLRTLCFECNSGKGNKIESVVI